MSNEVSELHDVPTVCMSRILNGDTLECQKVVSSFHTLGIVIVKDDRVSETDNATFLDTMETYFEQPTEKKKEDSRPDLYFQVGSTPAFVEKPRNHCDKVIPGIDRPVTLCPPSKDAKWRYFWRIGERKSDTQFPELNAKQVIPTLFADRWKEIMDNWGNKLYQSVWDISKALAVGLHLPSDTFQKQLLFGPHLLAPTGTDLQKFGKDKTVMAGYHYDLNFITCHGKSRFPGLFIWLKNGKRVPVQLPDGCLLMQAGMQLEWMTGGYIKAGYHEVVVSEDTIRKIQMREEKRESLWRVSSTFFSHLCSDSFLRPLVNTALENVKKKYPRVQVGQQVKKELGAIQLKTDTI